MNLADILLGGAILVLLSILASALHWALRILTTALEMFGSHFREAPTKTDLHKLEIKIMSSQKDLADGLLAVVEQQKKTRGEIQTVQLEVTTLKEKIVDLEAQIAAGGPVTPELQAAFDAVKEQAQIVDDEIPDMPTTPVPVIPAG